jgi:hypothetical protein
MMNEYPALRWIGREQARRIMESALKAHPRQRSARRAKPTRGEGFFNLIPKRECLALVLLLASLSSHAQPNAASTSNAMSPGAGYKVVLVAGDDSLNVFDTATRAVRKQLLARQGIVPADITMLSASPRMAAHGAARLATLKNILMAVADMKPGPGQGCLVFATSHGVQDAGMWLAASQGPMSPLALDLALSTGCGEAPTVVVISACFSGVFASPPMTKPNRIVLTAARPDRTSFGCKAGRRYTVYDQCFLRAFAQAGDWRQVYDLTRGCVAEEEAREQVEPSEPQAFFGAEVATLPLPPAKALTGR